VNRLRVSSVLFSLLRVSQIGRTTAGPASSSRAAITGTVRPLICFECLQVVAYLNNDKAAASSPAIAQPDPA